MRKTILLVYFIMSAASLYSQPVVNFNFVTHNEETSQWNNRIYYITNRTRLISLADYFQTNGITWNMQSDHVYLSNVLTQETGTLMMNTNNKNILLYLEQDKGVEMDPHAHESIYIYPDVVKLMDSIGLPESKIMGGSIYNDSNGINVWTNLINGQYGIIFPNKFWKPDFMMGGGTPNHINDLNYYGFWNPTDTNAYLVNNPASPLHHIGVGCGIKIQDTSTVEYVVSQIRDVLTNVQSGNYPATGIYLQTIFFEQGDLNNMLFYNKVIEVADSVNQMVLSGQAQWRTLKQVGDYWLTTYNSQMFQWECGETTTGIEEENNLSVMNIYPNPAGDMITIHSQNPISEINITNIVGEKIKKLSGNIHTIDISKLSNGIYFLKATTDKQAIIIQKISVNR